MKMDRKPFISLILVALSFGTTMAFFSKLPEKVPIHWNAAGVADGFSPKPWGPFILPSIGLAIFVMFLVIPNISPKGFEVEKFRRVFENMQLSVVAFLFFVTVLSLLAGAGKPVQMENAIEFGVGVLFILMGHFLGKVGKNYFVGIRTPWTLSNDEVWLRTQKLGGKLFVLAGLAILVSALLGGGTLPFFIAVAVAAGVPTVYSYVLYRRIEATPSHPGDDKFR